MSNSGPQRVNGNSHILSAHLLPIFSNLEYQVYPGETVLAFYTATNPTDRPIDGIATYNVIPFEAGQYFNKIQCFCFEEQRLNPKEQVSLKLFPFPNYFCVTVLCEKSTWFIIGHYT